MRQATLSLIILSFMLGFIAPACGFMWGGQYSVIEICTTQGIEQRIVLNDTNPTQPNHDHEQSTEECEFCYKNANLGSYLLNSNIITALIFEQKTKITFARQNKLAEALSTVHLARGPPSFS